MKKNNVVINRIPYNRFIRGQLSGKFTKKNKFFLLLVFQFLCFSSFAQFTVTGTVHDANGNALVGATVGLKEASNASTTNNDGHYSINLPDGNGTLVFTYVGFKSEEVAIGGRKNINIVLQGDQSSLQGVVVIGYGTQSRANVTTSISKLDNKVLENIPYTNAASAMEGTIPGVRVQSTSGQPGAAPRVIVRGGTSINNPNGATPLYIVDGVIRPNMNDISADDIGSLQVLKDAGATAIYGSRGSNGVVLITTKSGKAGRTRVSYKYDLTFSEVGKKYDMASARDYIYYSRIGAKVADRKVPNSSNALTQPSGYGTGNDLTNNTGFTTQYLTSDNEHKLKEGWQSMPDPVDPGKTIIFKGTDWQDVLFQTGVSHNHHISVDGGSNKATFSAGLGYMTNDGVAITTNYKRLTLSLNGKIQVRDNLNVFARMMYTNSNDNEVYDITQIFFRSVGLAPTAKYTFEDGTLAPGFARNIGNPAYFLNRDISKNSTENLTMAMGGNWDILPGLSFDPQISLYKMAGDNYGFLPSYWNGVSSLISTRTASSSYSKFMQYQADGVLNYHKTFASSHNLEALAGLSYIGRENFSLSATGDGAATDLIPTLNASARPVSVGGARSNQALMGYFARINYNYKQKYLVSLTSRYDGASNLGADHKWGLFPGVSLGWNVHNESFWSALPQDLIQLKLRASYGVTGNISGLSDFQAQGAYSVGNRYMGASAIENTVIANHELKWEQSKTLDFGTDIGLFHRRIDIIFDYYRRVTNDLLTTLTLPQSTGFSSIFTNLGSLENKGVEIEMGVNVLPSTSALQWRVAVNGALTKHKIIRLPNNGTENNRVGGNYVWDSKTKGYAWMGGLQEGGRIGDFYSWKQIGVYATDKDAASAPVDITMPFANKTKYGGDVIYADLDKNDTIDVRDLTYMGNPFPKWTGGITSSLSYKGFTLYTRLDYIAGHTIYNHAKIFLAGSWAGNLNIPQEMIDDGWKKEGDIASRPQYIPGTANYSYWRGSAYHTTSTNSEFYESGNFLCLREVTLTYALPSTILSKLNISNLSFNVTGSNLYYFTKYTGMNPEDGGSDDGRYPMPRNITIGGIISF